MRIIQNTHKYVLADFGGDACRTHLVIARAGFLSNVTRAANGAAQLNCGAVMMYSDRGMGGRLKLHHNKGQ